jgi:hypothetical protein
MVVASPRLEYALLTVVEDDDEVEFVEPVGVELAGPVP